MGRTQMVMDDRSYAETLSGDELLAVVYDLLDMIGATPFVPCYDCGKPAVSEFSVYRRSSTM